MKFKNVAVISLAIMLFGIFGITFGSTVHASHDAEEKSDLRISDSAKLSLVDQDEKFFKIKINYQLNKKSPVMIIKTPNIENIDFEDLNTKFGGNNVKLNKDKGMITLNLKYFTDVDGTGELNLRTLNFNDTTIMVMNASQVTLAQETFHKEVEPGENIDTDDEDESENATEYDPDDERNPDSGWKNDSKNELMVTAGKQSVDNNGNKITPVIYFGDFKYAKKGISIHESVGSFLIEGRKNNITAANYAVIKSPRGTDWWKSSHNTIWTTSYGDGDTSSALNPERGSQRTFVTTDLYNEMSPSDDPLRPKLVGPDYEKNHDFPNLGMNEKTARIYTRDNPKTGLKDQRIAFQQEFGQYKIRISITQSFDENNMVITKIKYRNVGKLDVSRFTGFSFKSLHLMRNFQMVDKGDVFKLRSLGNNQGAYATSEDFEGRYEMYLNKGKDAPFAWGGGSQRMAVSSTDSEKEFPWARPSQAVAEDNSRKYEVFPLLHNYNVFKDLNDLGYKTRNPNAGVEFTKEEMKHHGVAMHTKNRLLKVGQSVNMSYTTNFFLADKEDPTVHLYERGTQTNPQVVQPNANTYKLTGKWYDYNDRIIKLYYSIDSEDKKNPKFIQEYQQTNDEMKRGTSHRWGHQVPVKSLSPGQHVIRVWGINRNDRVSEVESTVIQISEKSTSKPQITLTSPNSNTSEDKPMNPIVGAFDFKGTWSDADSKSVGIKYKIDDEETKVLFSKLKNDPETDKVHQWEMDDFDLRKFNDTNPHKISFIITDDTDQSSETTFYFKREKGAFQLIHPEKIDFGLNKLSPHKDKTTQPSLRGDLKIHDYRGESKIPLKIVVTVNDFIKSGKNQSPTKLKACYYWDNTLMTSGKSFQIGDGIHGDSDVWLKTTDLSEEFEKKFAMKVHHKDNSDGKYKSLWTWSATDSI
ncbi:hypothetical protein [Companilactobacillus mishanensis]|uniref:WxL domain-containing protein n=1 Tax=Companilactobacillus mishanensis TaxID=2486008 RepID=A0ABW9P5N1_9LACO|nr:hypothetical protein [Companilactobacillus mishanensis]MQS44531.1 hypothetical protein [Companilactobacillus mishanensis]